jgi:hypothetical protein
MARYLDKFRGTIGKKQADQIIKLLNRKKNVGQIRSVDEFSRQLDELIRELTGTFLQPTLQLFTTSENRTIDSEEYNFMLDRVQDDLEAVFEEANNIAEVQTSHEAIIRDVVLKNLRAGVAELESKINLYEFLNRDNHGFDQAIFSTFRESKEERTQRGEGLSSLFLDPRTSDLFSVVEDATVELVGERLTLAIGDKTFHPISAVRQVFDSTFPQSEKIVESPGSKLSNIIDNTSGTFWIQSLLFPEKPTNVKVKLELDLGAVREVNFIEIEPISHQGVYLQDIHYVDGNNIVTLLLSPEQFVDSPFGIQIRKIATRKIILTFRNENGNQSSFQHTTQDTLLNQNLVAQEQKVSSFAMPGIAGALDPLLGSQQVKEIVGVDKPSKSTYAGFAFTTGFDNIRVGLASYRNNSIYVSSPLELRGASQVGLKTLESRPIIDDTDGVTKYTSTTYDGDDDNFYLGSIEYWVVKQDFNADGVLFRTSRFSILPIGIQRVHHERLLLTEKSSTTLNDNDIGTAVFYTVSDTGGGGDGNVTVFRNGVVLTNVDSIPLATEGWRQADPITTNADKTPGNGSPMRFRIQIVGALPGDIYTVSYNPMVSSTPNVPQPPYGPYTSIGGLQVVDLVGDLTIRRNSAHVIVAESPEESQAVDVTKLFLVIILRQNTAEPALTPIVEEYTLMGSHQDVTKFEEE